MTSTDARRDSGTQPQPHYCTTQPREDGTVTGCPEWPTCLFAAAGPPLVADLGDAERRAHLDAALAAAKRESWHELGRDLAALAGFVAGAVLVLTVGAMLLPLLV
jgi:hypothetical protein